MGGKRKKHKPSYKPKPTPKERHQDKAPSSSEFSELPLLVFISSLIDKMLLERAAVQRAVDSVPIARSWRFENAPASSQPVRDAYLSKVRTCDIFVLVLGYEYSKAVAKEYETAIESKRPILAFVQNGDRQQAQQTLVDTIGSKYSPYEGLDDLERLVAASIWDELIRSYRSSLPPNAAAKAIEQMPRPHQVGDISGYFIAGLESEVQAKLFKTFGAKDVPPNLESLYPTFEPLPVINFVEISTAATAFRNAIMRAQTAEGDKEKAYIREFQKEAAEIASQYLKRQDADIPEPDERMPGINYYIWGIQRDYAHIVKLLRLEGQLKPTITVERKGPEVMFKDINQFIKVISIFREAGEKAGDDMNEFRRLLILEATLIRLDEMNEDG